MKRLFVVSLLIALSGCALPQTVQRIGVEYNTAVAGMADELALLNIVRAEEGMPLHYTSVSRLSGSVILKATSGLNEQIKYSAPTALNSTQTTTPGGSSIASSIVSTASRSVLSGGNILTPSIGGEVDTGPSFDIAILDSQNFYNGILSPVPATTIANFVAQGYDPRVLLSLFAQRIDFKLKGEVPGVSAKKGDILLSVTDADKGGRTAFMETIECFDLVTVPADDSNGRDLLPVSRITTDKDGNHIPFALKDIASLDGVGLTLSAPITDDPMNDKNVEIIRPSRDKQAVRLRPNGTCVHPLKPPPNIKYTGDNKIMIATRDINGRLRNVEVDPQVAITFRSPEGAIHFLGDCLNASNPKNGMRQCIIDKMVLFTLGEGEGESAITTQLMGKEYFIAANDRSTFQSLALIEQLISLEQSATDKPITVPVQVVP